MCKWRIHASSHGELEYWVAYLVAGRAMPKICSTPSGQGHHCGRTCAHLKRFLRPHLTGPTNSTLFPVLSRFPFNKGYKKTILSTNINPNFVVKKYKSNFYIHVLLISQISLNRKTNVTYTKIKINR